MGIVDMAFFVVIDIEQHRLNWLELIYVVIGMALCFAQIYIQRGHGDNSIIRIFAL